MEPKYLTCHELIELLGIADALGFWQRVRFRLHLTFCSSCRAYLRSYYSTISMARLAGERVPDEVPEELVRTILQMR